MHRPETRTLGVHKTLLQAGTVGSKGRTRTKRIIGGVTYTPTLQSFIVGPA